MTMNDIITIISYSCRILPLQHPQRLCCSDENPRYSLGFLFVCSFGSQQTPPHPFVLVSDFVVLVVYI